jgi:hypothetical protein
MKKILLLSLMIVLFTSLGFAQSDKFWSSYAEVGTKITTDKAISRLSFPKTFKLFYLNINSLRQELFTIVGNNATKHSTIISLPNVNGALEQFEVFEASNFEPALQDLFPEIRAFSGRGITDKYASLKLSISPQGIQTMIFRTEKAAEFIEAYSQDHTIYAAFNSNREKGSLPWRCTTEDHIMMDGIKSQVENTNRPEANDGTLKTMRLAQSCNGEYANFFGATSSADVALVIAAFNATLTRCNGCYEKDLALHLNLIATTTDVIFYDPVSDPYTTMANWNSQLQGTLNSTIGAANYDIGHMFGATGGGGNAGCIGCVCNDANKGSGITSPPTGQPPSGDNFDIDYVVHEIGHQLGGTHTFSNNIESGGLTNKEVGSGITIMGYAGITSQDVAPHSIAFYHEVTIQQIQNNLASKTCPITTNISAVNSTPVVAPVNNRIIPISTPFILTGSATDANPSDALTYSWEQNDSGNSTTTGVNSVANPTKLIGPNWLSFAPTASPSRTLPRLTTILAGLFVTPVLPGGDAIANIEALSSVGRNLNFRLTVRDNAPYVSSGALSVGQTAFTDMIVTVDPTSGPFQVTIPNTNLSWPTSSAQTVTWSVNNTTAAPVSCANVNILISLDGGFNFTTLLANTPNDGTEVVTMPSTASTTARIKVESVGNIFFDISNTNFTIAVPTSDFNFGATTAATAACPAPATMAVTLPVGAIGTFANPVTLSATAGVPTGTSISFGTNPVTPGNSSVVTLNNANTLAAGTYTVTISGSATGGVTKTTSVTYTITAGAPPVITTQPVSTSVCVGAAAPTFTVASSTAGVSYQWQSATAAAPTVFTNIAGATTAAYNTGTVTAAMNGNVYHCTISTLCGSVVSNNAVLTVNTAAAFTTLPSNFPACTGLTATFNASATGTGVTYQWTSSTSIGGPFTNIPGATAASYTTPPITVTTPTFYQVVASTTLCPATVTSTAAQLTVSTTTAIGTQPTAQTLCVPAAATFTGSATGTGVAGGALQYQWQVATAAAPTVFTNIAGATSATYNTGATTATMNGNIYHLVVTGACNTATTNNVTLTANTVVALGAIVPTAQTVCNGTAATFTGSTTGTGVTYQWQSGPSSTGPWNTVTGGTGSTTASYTTAVTTPSMNGTWYRMVAITTTCSGSVTTTPVLLTVNTVAVINTNHSAQSACVPQTATFTVAASGTGLTYQWQVQVPGGSYVDIPGATSATYTTPATTLAMNGNQYRVNILSTCSPTTPTTSNPSTLTVNNPVTISAQPTAQSGCSNDNYTFSVTAVSPGNTITYAWEVSTTGAAGPFTPLANNAIYGGVNTSALTITNAPLFINGNYYRVFISVPCGTGVSSSYSAAALFNISSKPTVVLTKPVVSNTNAGVNTIITTTVSPYTVGQNATYTWKKNGTIIPNTLASTSIVVPVDDAGSYQVSITDAATGCIALSNIIVTDARTSDNLLPGRVFIYPNPVSTKMIVRYNNSDAGNRATSIAVYDDKGARVITKAFSIVGTNGRMEIDMSRLALGTYIVYVIDANGKKLAAGKAVKVQ